LSNRIILKDAYKGYTLDQDKICTPKETVERFKNRLQDTGLNILEKTVRIDNGRLDIPVYFSLCGRDAEEVVGTKKQMGKGGTPDQAEASAVMELAERFSFFSFIRNEKNFFMDQYMNLKDQALPFEDIAKSVHDESIDLEIEKGIFSGLPLKWTWAYNMTKEQEVLMPFDWFYAINEFNGPSAGNCIEEALSQGICEIVERHVSSIISRNHLNTPAIDVSSLKDPLILEMIGKYKQIGVNLFINDFSMDMGIPSVGVLAYDPSTLPHKSEIVWTAGTTPDPQKALSRALTEVAQLAGDFNSGSNYVASGLPKFRSLDEADYVLNPGNTIDMKQLPDLSDDNIKVEVESLISALSNRNMEVIAINTTHEHLRIPAFYTIIPGAHFRERAANTSVGMFCAKLVVENYDPQRAINELNKIDDILPGRYFLKFYLGVSHLSIGDVQRAFDYFNEAINLEPHEEDIPSIYSYMGVCLKEQGKYREALPVLEKAEEYDPERTDIYNLMGFCYFKMKEHEKAIECFRKVIRLDPSSAIDYANIASNYRDMGEKEKAIKHYELALELDPNIDFARHNLEKLKSLK